MSFLVYCLLVKWQNMLFFQKFTSHWSRLTKRSSGTLLEPRLPFNTTHCNKNVPNASFMNCVQSPFHHVVPPWHNLQYKALTSILFLYISPTFCCITIFSSALSYLPSTHTCFSIVLPIYKANLSIKKKCRFIFSSASVQTLCGKRLFTNWWPTYTRNAFTYVSRPLCS